MRSFLSPDFSKPLIHSWSESPHKYRLQQDVLGIVNFEKPYFMGPIRNVGELTTTFFNNTYMTFRACNKEHSGEVCFCCGPESGTKLAKSGITSVRTDEANVTPGIAFSCPEVNLQRGWRLD